MRLENHIKTKFSQSDPVSIRPKLSSVLVQSDPVLSVLISTTLSQKRAVFPAFSSHEVTLGQMRKISIHFIIYPFLEESGLKSVDICGGVTPKTCFGSEILFGVIIVVVGRVFCQDDCGAKQTYTVRRAQSFCLMRQKDAAFFMTPMGTGLRAKI